MCRAQLLSRVDAPALAAQPLPVEEMCASVFRCDAAATEPVDRLAVELLCERALAEERVRARLDAAGPFGPRRTRSLGETLERGGRELALGAAGRRLDELAERPRGDGQLVLRARALCPGERRLVPAEAVVEKRAGVLDEGEQPALTSGDRHGLADLEQSGYRCLVAAEAGERQSCETDACGAGRIGDRVRLSHQSLRRIEIAFEAAQRREVVERQREHSERASLAGHIDIACGGCMGCLVIEHVERHASGEPGSADVLPGMTVVVLNCAQCLLEQARAGHVAVGEPDRQSVQEQVDGTRRAA